MSTKKGLIKQNDIKNHLNLYNLNINSKKSSLFIKFLLARIEKKLSGNNIENVDEYILDHIMPETLNEDWITELSKSRADFKQIHSENLHKLGNLTLIHKNKSLLKNKPFYKKQINGYENSKLELNEGLKTKHIGNWGKKQINNRTNFLANIIFEIWKDISIEEKIVLE